MRILVTGASGFIGGRVIQFLISNSTEKHQVIATSRSMPKMDLNPSNPPLFVTGDLQDPVFCSKITEGIDAVINCAGKAGTWGDYQGFWKANVYSTELLLKASQKNGVKRFIHISSPSIYFEFKNQFNLKENDLPKKFSNHYARTKYESELLVLQAHSSKFNTVALRPRFVLGAGDFTVFPRMIRLQEKGLFYQIGNGKNVIDVTNVSNLVELISKCLYAPESAMGEVYNVSNGKPILFLELVDKTLGKLGIPQNRKKIPRSLLMGLAKMNEYRCKAIHQKEEPSLLPLSVAVLSQSMTLNIDKVKTKLGYTPRHSTEEGIEEFAIWWLNQKKASNHDKKNSL